MPPSIDDPFEVTTPELPEEPRSTAEAIQYLVNDRAYSRYGTPLAELHAMRQYETTLITRNIDRNTELQHYCRVCNEQRENENLRWEDGGMVCDTCYAWLPLCGRCSYAMLRDRVRIEGEPNPICLNCARELLDANSHRDCEHCGCLIRVSQRPYCEQCVKTLKKGKIIWYRKPHILLSEGNNNFKKGDILIHDRKIGVELELIAPDSQTASTLSWETPANLGIGSDGSITITGKETPLEIQTPPQAGKLAEETIKNLCEELLKAKCKTNISCGYHVHIDLNDIDKLNANEQTKRAKILWLTYLSFEDVLLSFLPPSRQENRRYAMPLRADYHADEIIKAKNMTELEQLWYRLINPAEIVRAKNEHRHPTRYRGINLHPFFSGRHLEIRYHSGTLNSTKILEWANLNVRLVEVALKNLFTELDSFKAIINDFNLERKTENLFRTLKLDEKSMGYFRARQRLFMPKLKDIDNSHVENGMKLLTNEKEI
jgi:hypothetical protein